MVYFEINIELGNQFSNLFFIINYDNYYDDLYPIKIVSHISDEHLDQISHNKYHYTFIFVLIFYKRTFSFNCYFFYDTEKCI